MVPGAGRDLPTLFEQLDGLSQAALVGYGSGRYEATLRDQRGARRGITQLAPEDLDVIPPSLGAVAVS